MEYDFRKIEAEWKKYWVAQKVYQVNNDTSGPKCYVLDMFPYPSGAGLHVGHPLGYIASDIYARYKRLCGYNVLHPMGFDDFGLPAEQYAIETGQHPAITTEKNISRYREQLDNIGFCYDWDREVRTSDPNFYKWTQWIFLQLFHSWYDHRANKTRPLNELIEIFERQGNMNNECPEDEALQFNNATWAQYAEAEKRAILMKYRVAYQGYAQVWWCDALGTVLANDEVVNGVSERGGHPVERKNMRQWFLRITEYADRLLSGLDTLDWSDAMKEMQRNWIGKSNGAEVRFRMVIKEEIEENGDNYDGHIDLELPVFTTRPDTIFGVDFMVLAPEHELVEGITTPEQKQAIDEYRQYVKSRSERERMSEVKQVTGCFTGAYAIHPLTEENIPVWISEYVLAGYGTGAIMGVPSGDDRDHAFAKHFNIPVTNIFGDKYNGSEACSAKSGTLENSGFLTGLSIAEATESAIKALEDIGAGKRKINYKLRDAGYSRQRYWGEPFPIIYVDGVPYGIDEAAQSPTLSLPEREGETAWQNALLLPVELPYIESYKPGPEGQGPLANLKDWVNIPLPLDKAERGALTPQNTSLPFGEGRGGGAVWATRETNTMPGYAGSSWYFLRYMDPHNNNEFASREAIDYWKQVDLYIGGTEHAVGHLLYSRMWTKALYDLGFIGFDEPFKRLLNQGMIQGQSYYTGVFIAYNKNVKESEEIFLTSIGNVERFSEIKENIPFKFNGKNFYRTSIEIKKLKYGYLFVDSKDRLTKSKYSEQLAYEGYDSNYIHNRLEHFHYRDLTEDGEEYIQCKLEIEKMSKSKYNVVNPDDIVAQYGADTFRMYEMFLGPVEMSKPWDTKGIEGVHRFLKKMWRLYMDEQQGWIVTDEKATDAELRILHKTIKKISGDIERFSFNTSVSQFMICVNELSALGCHKREILEPLAVVICPFAPHIAEELWHRSGHTGSVVAASFPRYEERYIAENTKKYPVAVNGKTRVEMEFPLEAEQAAVQQDVLADPTIQKWMEGQPLKKFIYVKGKMINVVV